MRSSCPVFLLLFSLIAEPIGAAPQEEKAVTWAQLRAEVADRRLTGRFATISLSNGESVSSTLRGIEEDALVVEANPKTEKRWRETNGRARIPRAELAALRFAGKQTKKGLIGLLAGLGAGAAATAAGAKSMEGQEGPAGGAVLVAIPVFAVIGYLIGRHFDKPIPRFRIVP